MPCLQKGFGAFTLSRSCQLLPAPVTLIAAHSPDSRAHTGLHTHKNPKVIKLLCACEHQDMEGPNKLLPTAVSVQPTCKASSLRHLLFRKTQASFLRQADQAVALHPKVPLQLVSISSNAYAQLVYVLQAPTHLESKPRCPHTDPDCICRGTQFLTHRPYVHQLR